MQCSVNIILQYIFMICKDTSIIQRGNAVLFSSGICEGTIVKQVASLQLSIVKIRREPRVVIGDLWGVVVQLLIGMGLFV